MIILVKTQLQIQLKKPKKKKSESRRKPFRVRRQWGKRRGGCHRKAHRQQHT